MIVTATNLPFLPYVELFLESLIDWHRTPAERVAVIVMGSKEETRFLKRRLAAGRARLTLDVVDPRDPELGWILRLPIEHRWIVFADYVKAVASRRYPACGWVDGDVLAQRSTATFTPRLLGGAPLGLALERVDPKVSQTSTHTFNPRWYFEIYRALYGDYPTVHVDRLCLPCVHNAGVIMFGKDLCGAWTEAFRELTSPSFLERARRLKKGTPLLSTKDLGQLVWNLVFWREEGALLPECYNRPYFMRRRPDTVFTHYSRGQGKLRMLGDYMKTCR